MVTELEFVRAISNSCGAVICWFAGLPDNGPSIRDNKYKLRIQLSMC